MAEKEVCRYLQLASRKSFILTHSGISWKPEYGPELEAINQELGKLRKVIDQEHANRRKRREAMQ